MQTDKGRPVQSYTHPLWMLVMAACYAVAREGFFTIIALNILVSMAAMCVLALCVARSVGHALAAVAILTLSHAPEPGDTPSGISSRTSR